MGENKKAPDCVAAQKQELKKNIHQQNTTTRAEVQELRPLAGGVHKTDLEALCRAKYRKGQKLQLRWTDIDPLEKNGRMTRWRPVEVEFMGQHFMTLRFLDIRERFGGKQLKGYCVTVLYADLLTGRAAIR